MCCCRNVFHIWKDCLSSKGRPPVNGHFCSCDLELDPMTLTYELDLFWRCACTRIPKVNFLGHGFQTLRTLQNTDRRTCNRKHYHIAFAGSVLCLQRIFTCLASKMPDKKLINLLYGTLCSYMGYKLSKTVQFFFHLVHICSVWCRVNRNKL